jgi:hypothetical protein
VNEETGDPSAPPTAPDEAVPGETAPGQNAPDQSIGDSFVRLLADGRAYIEAEADRQKLRAGIFTRGLRDAAILVVVALMLLFGTLVAFLIGLIIALSPILTPLGATGAVFGGAVLVSLALLLLAKARISRMKKAAKG